jgi:hypothetical protein
MPFVIRPSRQSAFRSRRAPFRPIVVIDADLGRMIPRYEFIQE